MKTAISIPDEVFRRVERVAAKHDMNRSQFFAVAADRYADELESAAVTAAIDAVADVLNGDESTRWAVAAGRRAFAKDEPGGAGW
jgi:metal-responsive CopG/Arc/MetJ family transcriptional regulator